MTDHELKELNQKLWHAADQLRAGAHLSANRYGQPILGLIFLRYADILFKQHSAEIQKEFDRLKKTRMAKSVKKIAIEKCGFYQYRDVIGLCKVAKLEGEDGIIDQDYSLNPGRYVGVVIEDDGMTAEEFKAEIGKLGDDFAANAKGLFA